MAAYTSGSLELDNVNGTYHAGDVCSGTVVIRTREAHSVLGINLHFLGEVTSSLPEFNYVTRSESLEVMNYYEILSNSSDKDAEGNCTLAEGENRFPFKSKLPDGLPANFSLENVGTIKYSLELKIHINEYFSRGATKKLYILDSLDLNTIPGLREPHWCLSYWNEGCICQEKVQLDASVSRTGFAIGENASCKIKVENRSRKKLKVRCALIQVVTQKVDGINLQWRIPIDETTKQRCRRGNSEFDEIGLVIPEVHASYVSGLLDISYELAAIIGDSSKDSLLSVKIPIVIGNIALTNNPEMTTPTPFRASANESRNESSAIQIDDAIMLV